jgi:site-specific recombinase XerD
MISNNDFIALEYFLKNHCNYLSLSKNTINAYESDLKDFLEFIHQNEYKLIDITSQQINLFFEKLYQKQYKPSSLSRKYSALNAFFEFLLLKETINQNPLIKTSRIKNKNKLPKLIHQNNINKILNSLLANPNRPNKNSYKSFLKKKIIVYLLIFTGMRVSEIIKLQKKQFLNINQQNSITMITIVGKGNKERSLPIKNEIIAMIQEFAEIYCSESEYIFASNSKTKHISRVYILQLIKKLALKLNINQNISPHMFRHSFATNLLENNIDIRYIQDILGHKTIQTTRIYAETSNEKIKNELKKFHPEFF